MFKVKQSSVSPDRLWIVHVINKKYARTSLPPGLCLMCWFGCLSKANYCSGVTIAAVQRGQQHVVEFVELKMRTSRVE